MKIILVEPSHPGNIGAAARAMKVMGLNELILIQPPQQWETQALAMASHADDILAQAQCFESLSEALQTVDYALATTARARHVDWPVKAPRAWMAACAQRDNQSLAVVFGRERTGLTNTEIARCQGLIHIPTSSAYQSLNLAQAVQIVAYEWQLAFGQGPSQSTSSDKTTEGATWQYCIEQIKQLVDSSHFSSSEQAPYTAQRLQALLARANPSDKEQQLLAGFLSACAKQLIERQ